MLYPYIITSYRVYVFVYICFYSSLVIETKSQDINPRIFLIHKNNVNIYSEITVDLSNSNKIISTLSKGTYTIGYQPITTELSSLWIEIVYPVMGYIYNQISNTNHKFTLLELDSEYKTCNKRCEYLQEYDMLTTCGFSRSWMNQWPIGNGIMGALVGGTLAQENIPLSISDLYVSDRNQFEDGYNFAKSPRKEFNGSFPMKSKILQQARDALLTGNFKSAYTTMDNLRGASLGRFEYLVDLTLIYLLPKHFEQPIEQSEQSILLSNKALLQELKLKTSNSSNTNNISNKMKKTSKQNTYGMIYNLQGRQDISQVMESGGREELFRMAAYPLKIKPVLGAKFRLDAQSTPQNSILSVIKHLSTLRMTDGIATSTFLVPIPTIKSDSTVVYTPIVGFDHHMRQWFATEVDDVVVGKMSCLSYQTASSGTNRAMKSKGCLDILWRISREPQGKNPENLYSYSMTKTKTNIKKLTDDGTMMAIQHRIGVGMVSNSQTLVAPSYTCSVINCVRPINSTDFDTDIEGKFDEYSSSGSCLNSEEVTVISHTEKQENMDFLRDLESGPLLSQNVHKKKLHQAKNKANGAKQPNNIDPNIPMEGVNYGEKKLEVMKMLSEKCWKVVDSANNIGYEKLLHRHTEFFKKRMNKVRIEMNELDVDDMSISTDEKKEVKFVNQAVGMYSMGKYMMLSSATKSVPNLQGLWADGKKSIWNGDYHLNINLQMMYFGVDSSGLDETITPLLNFIDKLSKRGQVTAKNIYGCGGWVAHGFTDGYLDTGLAGELYWSLCVTCGAWLSLAIWKHLVFKLDLNIIATKLLPIYEGIATFFLDYLFPVNNNLYVGPSTSPETSFATSSSIVTLAFNTAIDMSILRQISNAYNLAVDMLRSMDKSQVYMSKSRLTYHKDLATRFLDAVHKLPFDAQPIIGAKSFTILEYPLPFPDALTTQSAIDNFTISHEETIERRKIRELSDKDKKVSDKVKMIMERNRIISDSKDKNEKDILPYDLQSRRVHDVFDPRHRHFSHMHWLYPGLFLPENNSNFAAAEDLYKAAKQTLLQKWKAKSGHTSWSASWLSCLWSRLGPSAAEASWIALTSILKKYVTGRYLSLHPALQKDDEKPQGNCPTCYYARKSEEESPEGANSIRSIMSLTGSVFQMDGNMGFLAAMNEILLQSHVSGYILLLQALPKILANVGGRVLNMRARGDVEVSFAWTGQSFDQTYKLNQNNRLLDPFGGKIYAMKMLVKSYHPWYAYDPKGLNIGGMYETKSGYYSWYSYAMSSKRNTNNNINNNNNNINDDSRSSSLIAVVLPYSEQNHLILRKSNTECGKIVSIRHNQNTTWSKKPYHSNPTIDINELINDENSHSNNNNNNNRNGTQDRESLTTKLWSSHKKGMRGSKKKLLSRHFKEKSFRMQPDDENLRMHEITEIKIHITSYPCEITLCWDSIAASSSSGKDKISSDTLCQSIFG